MTKKVLILGGSGMLGSMVADYLSHDPDLEVTATARTQDLIDRLSAHIPGAAWRLFDAGSDDDTADALAGQDYVINAIGVIKPLIHDDNAAEVERAIRINAYFPYRLAQWVDATGARVLQIATDCVYSGTKGDYVEDDAHDPLDVYGKTKSLGEVRAGHVHHLRCSIIGPEPAFKPARSLLEWFLGQPENGKINGFTNHRWNGVTTLHYAKLCRGIITHDIDLPHVQHIIPAGQVTKYELVKSFAQEYRRADVSITPFEASVVIDRTLATHDDALNRTLWEAAGYAEPPTVPDMVAEMAQFAYRLK